METLPTGSVFIDFFFIAYALFNFYLPCYQSTLFPQQHLHLGIEATQMFRAGLTRTGDTCAPLAGHLWAPRDLSESESALPRDTTYFMMILICIFYTYYLHPKVYLYKTHHYRGQQLCLHSSLGK